jgi:hypothetical protein
MRALQAELDRARGQAEEAQAQALEAAAAGPGAAWLRSISEAAARHEGARDRGSLRAEVERLQQENAQLKQALSAWGVRLS